MELMLKTDSLLFICVHMSLIYTNDTPSRKLPSVLKRVVGSYLREGLKKPIESVIMIPYAGFVLATFMIYWVIQVYLEHILGMFETNFG